MAQAAVLSRMSREIRMLQTEPPPGIWAAPVGDKVTELEAQLQGPKDTVYEEGLFKLAVDIPARYPFEPPKVKFVTPIYHPNIDPEGRICLDILNMPPKGAWKPSLNVPTALASIGLLLAEPNPDDGLVTDITFEFRHQREVFDAKARQWTKRHAMQQDSRAAGTAGSAACGREKAAASEAAAAQQNEQGEQPRRVELEAVAANSAAVTEGPSTESRKENSEPGQRQINAKQQPQQQKEGQAEAKEAPAADVAAEQPFKRPRLALRK